MLATSSSTHEAPTCRAMAQARRSGDSSRMVVTQTGEEAKEAARAKSLAASSHHTVG